LAIIKAASKACALAGSAIGSGVITARIGVARSMPGRITRPIRSRTVNTPTGRWMSPSASTTTMELMPLSRMVSSADRSGVSGAQVTGLRRAMLDSGLRSDCCSDEDVA